MSVDTPPPAKWPWSALGLDKMPPEVADVRRAYARALKKIDQSKDIEGFATLRFAYEQALALREGRTANADAKRACKAEAMTKAEPARRTTSDPSSEILAEAAQIKAIAEMAIANERAFTALLQSVTTPNLLQSFEQRVNAALDSPFMADPARKARLGTTIARHLQDTSQTLTSDEQALPSEITQSLLIRLDSEFGWLSDLSAFRRDFWHNNALLDLMLDRQTGGKRATALKSPVRRSALGKIWARVETYPTVATMAGLVLFMGLAVASGSNPDSKLLNALLLGAIWLIGLGIAFIPVWLIFAVIQRFFHRYTAGLMTGVLVLGLGLLITGYGPGGGQSQLLALALLVAIWPLSLTLKSKRGAQLESLLRRFVQHLKT